MRLENNKLWWSKKGHASFEIYHENYAHWSSHNLMGNGWSYCNHPNIDRLYVGTEDNKFQIYKIDQNDSSKSSLLNEYQDFDFNNPFILITGHSGSGTTIIVKFLRHLGAHFGDECGDIKIRKPMESSSIRCWWNMLHNPHPIPDLQESFKSILKSYNYKKHKINMVKLVDDNLGERSLVMGNVIPNLKVISVIKPPKPDINNETNEGKKFNNKDPHTVLLSQLPKLEGNSIFHLDWNRFFTDYQYCNKLLKFSGVDKTFNTQLELETFKKDIGFQPQHLN